MLDTVSAPALTRTATSDAAWITITSGASGTGNGSVSYRVAANTATAPRTGTLNIAGLAFTITQAAGTGEVEGGGTTPTPPSAVGDNCLSGQVDYVSFSLQQQASRLADEISIGGTKLCADCKWKLPLFGGFTERLEAARVEGLNVDVCYDEYGTLNYLRLRP